MTNPRGWTEEKGKPKTGTACPYKEKGPAIFAGLFFFWWSFAPFYVNRSGAVTGCGWLRLGLGDYRSDGGSFSSACSKTSSRVRT